MSDRSANTGSTSRARAVLDQVNLVVADMEESVEFYRLLGVDTMDVEGEWAPHHRPVESTADGLDADLDSSAFASVWNRGWPAGTTGVVVGFRVQERDAVDEIHSRIVEAGHRSQQEPYDAFWGARYAVVEDPSGIAIGIMSAADDAHRTPPPEPPAS